MKEEEDRREDHQLLEVKTLTEEIIKMIKTLLYVINSEHLFDLEWSTFLTMLRCYRRKVESTAEYVPSIRHQKNVKLDQFLT